MAVVHPKRSNRVPLIPRGASGCVGAVLGGPIGGLAAFYLTLWSCETEAASGNPGMMEVGWVFCFFTVPIGVVSGAISLGHLGAHFARKFNATKARPTKSSQTE